MPSGIAPRSCDKHHCNNLIADQRNCDKADIFHSQDSEYVHSKRLISQSLLYNDRVFYFA